MLLLIPKKCMVWEAVCPGADMFSRLAWSLCTQKTCKAFAQTLPPETYRPPCFRLSDAHRTILDHTLAAEEIRRVVDQEYPRQWAFIDAWQKEKAHTPVPESRFQWAYGLALSRSFQTGSEGAAFVPLADQ